MWLTQNFKLASTFYVSFKKQKLCICTKEWFSKALRSTLMTSQLQPSSVLLFYLSYKVLQWWAWGFHPKETKIFKAFHIADMLVQLPHMTKLDSKDSRLCQPITIARGKKQQFIGSFIGDYCLTRHSGFGSSIFVLVLCLVFSSMSLDLPSENWVSSSNLK